MYSILFFHVAHCCGVLRFRPIWYSTHLCYCIKVIIFNINIIVDNSVHFVFHFLNWILMYFWEVGPRYTDTSLGFSPRPLDCQKFIFKIRSHMYSVILLKRISWLSSFPCYMPRIRSVNEKSCMNISKHNNKCISKLRAIAMLKNTLKTYSLFIRTTSMRIASLRSLEIGFSQNSC